LYSLIMSVLECLENVWMGSFWRIVSSCGLEIGQHSYFHARRNFRMRRNDHGMVQHTNTHTHIITIKIHHNQSLTINPLNLSLFLFICSC
jgi:hypothetical protein